MKKSYFKLFLWVVIIVPLDGIVAKTQKETTSVFLADSTIFYDKGIYYLYGTEQNPNKGFPVLISKNLRKWEKPLRSSKNGYALLKGDQTFGMTGFWAPQVFAIYSQREYSNCTKQYTL